MSKANTTDTSDSSPNADIASRYLRALRVAGQVQVWTVLGVPLLYLCTGWSQRVRTTTIAIFDNYFVALAAAWIVFAVVLLVGAVAGGLALFRVQRRFHLSNQTVRSWLTDIVKAFGFTLGAGLLAVEMVYAAIRFSPQNWWVWAGAGLGLLFVAYAVLLPVLYLPLVFESAAFPNSELLERLQNLAVKAGVRVGEFRELRVSSKTRKAMAMVAGMGPTRRVLISDTLLQTCTPDETEALVAHELGHQFHHHLAKRALLHAVGIVACVYLLDALLRNDILIPFSSSFGGASDFAGLPALYFVFSMMMLYLRFLEVRYFRRNERDADLFCWKLLPNSVPAFISGLENISRNNLMEYSAAEQWRFSHPATAQRVATARKHLDSLRQGEVSA